MKFSRIASQTGHRPNPAMTDGVVFHQRIDQQYNALDQDEQQRFDTMVGRLQRGGIRSVPASKRKVLSHPGADADHTLWVLRLSSDLRVIVEEAEEALMVREIARKGRIQFYRDLAA